jgi:hypothetical protein
MNRILILPFLFILSCPIFAQEKNDQAFALSNKVGREFDEVFNNKNVLTISRKKDSIFFLNNEGKILNRFSASNLSNSQLAKYSLKDSFLLNNKLYKAELSVVQDGDNFSEFTYLLNEKAVLSVNRGKSYHCVNHDPITHKCPGPPALANPPCGEKGCIWKSD